MNSLCAIDQGILYKTYGVSTPNNFTAKYTLNIPLDNDPDLVLHYPFNHNIYNYGTSTSLSTNRGPNIGVQDATIVGATDISFLSTTTSIYNSGTSAYSNYFNVSNYLLNLYTFNSSDLSTNVLLNIATGLYDLIIDTSCNVNGSLDVPSYPSALIGAYSNIAIPVLLNKSGYSMGIWFNINIDRTAFIFTLQKNSSNYSDSIQIYYDSNGNNIICRISDGTNGNGISTKIASNIVLNLWNHFVLNIIGTTWNVYLNGVLTIFTGNTITSSHQYQYQYIGICKSLSPGQYFDGQVDNFFVYNGNLSSSQVFDIYSKGQNPTPSIDYVYTIPIQNNYIDPNLLNLYTFNLNDISGTDASGGRYLKNQANWNYDLLINPGVTIDGTENIPFTMGLTGSQIIPSINFNSSFTIGGWFYQISTTASFGWIFYAGTSTSTSQNSAQVYISDTKQFFLRINNVTTGNSTFGLDTISQNTWYFFCWIVQGTSWTCYLNNKVFNATRTNLTTDTVKTFNYIGRNLDSNIQNFYGKIDNFFVYNDSLTSRQVLEIYNKGQTPSEINYIYTVPIYNDYSPLYLSVNSIPTNTAGYTFSFWIYLDTSGGTGAIFSFANSLSSSNRISMSIAYNSGYYLYLYSKTTFISISTPIILMNQWTHVVWTLNTSNQSNIYVDGILISSPTTITYFDLSFNYGWIMADTYYSTSNSNGMLGYMNDFRYYDRVLDSAEVIQLSNIYDFSNNIIRTSFKLNADPTLCLYYTFDVSSNSITNYAPNYYGTIDASYVNGAYSNYSDISYVGTGGLKLKDTASGYVKFNSNNIVTKSSFLSDINNIGEGISFSCWFSSYNSGSRATIFDFAQGPDICANLIKLSIISNNISSQVFRPNGTTTSTLSSTGKNYNDGVIHHVVWTISFPTNGAVANASSIWNIYIDNSMVVNSTNRIFPSNASNTTRASCYLGKSNYLSTDPSFNGYIDDFRIYKRILTDTDISGIYYYRNQTKIKTLVNNSINLSWTPPVQYQNSSYNIYYMDNYSDISSALITQTSLTNYTYRNLLTGDGLTYYINSQVGQRNSSYVNSNIISNSLTIDSKLVFLYTFDPMDVSGSDATRYMMNQATGNYDLLLDTGVIIDGTENIPNLAVDASGSQITISINYETSFTIGGWIYITNDCSSNSWIYLSKGNGTGQIYIYTDSTSQLAFTVISDLSSSYISIANEPYNINSWNYFALIVSGSNWTTYVNGTSTLYTNMYTITSIQPNNYIGKNANVLGQNFEGGKIDGIFLINKALTVPQIVDIHMKGQIPSQTDYYYTIPIQYYQYTDPSYYVQDYLGPNPLVVDPSLVLFYTFKSTDFFQNNLKNQATGDYDLYISSNVTFDISNSGYFVSGSKSIYNTLSSITLGTNFTFGAWIYCDISDGNQRYIMSFATDNTGVNQIKISKSSSNDNISFRIVINNNNVANDFFPSNNFNCFQWYFIAVVYNNGNNTLFVNNTFTTATSSVKNFSNTSYNYIGSSNNFTSSIYTWVGYLSNVFLYEDALTNAQVLDIYNKTNPPYSLPITSPPSYYNTVPIQYYTYN
jgi:hypothetical protein